MNYWIRFIEKGFNESQIAFADYEFNIMKQELLIDFDELTEDFDRVFDDNTNELELSDASEIREDHEHFKKGESNLFLCSKSFIELAVG
jgi:hypothetical protein